MRDELELLHDARPHAAGPDPMLARRVRKDLLAEIATDPARPRRRWRRVAPVLAPAVAVVVATVLSVSLLVRGSDSAWAGELVEVAERAPRLLVDGEGWEVTRADQFAADLGEMTFANGGRELELRWQPADALDDLLGDRSRSADLATTGSAAGARARVFRYEGTNDFTAIWVVGDFVLEARGTAAAVDDFVAQLQALREVGVDAWLSAMPETVVSPVARAQVVAQMLDGIPLPPGFDPAPLGRGDAVRDRYQLGARVSGAVACAWIRSWVTARAVGNAALEARAVAVLAASRDWQVLRDLDDLGDYPEVVWQYADAVARDGRILAGRELSVEGSYRQALGCTGS